MAKKAASIKVSPENPDIPGGPITPLPLPQLFEMVSFLERYPPPVFMKWQLCRVFVLYIANLASLLWSLMDTRVPIVTRNTTVVQF